VHSRLALRKDGQPGLKIFKHNCPHLIHDPPRLTYADVGNEEDVDTACAGYATALALRSISKGASATNRSKSVPPDSGTVVVARPQINCVAPVRFGPTVGAPVIGLSVSSRSAVSAVSTPA